MSRQIDIVSTEDGKKFLMFGFDDSELATFSIQLWITKYGARSVDWLSPLGLSFISFMGGDLWVHNSDTAPRANLFGEQKDVKIGIVFNEDASRVKILDSLGVYSDTEWEVESLTIPSSLNYPSGMYSKIPSARFKKRDGVLRAEFLRNMKSSAVTASIQDAIKGEPLKGNTAYLVLKNVNNTSGEAFKLFRVEINATSLRGT
jgi:hypothetical protein